MCACVDHFKNKPTCVLSCLVVVVVVVAVVFVAVVLLPLFAVASSLCVGIVLYMTKSYAPGSSRSSAHTHKTFACSATVSPHTDHRNTMNYMVDIVV